MLKSIAVFILIVTLATLPVGKNEPARQVTATISPKEPVVKIIEPYVIDVVEEPDKLDEFEEINRVLKDKKIARCNDCD